MMTKQELLDHCLEAKIHIDEHNRKHENIICFLMFIISLSVLSGAYLFAEKQYISSLVIFIYSLLAIYNLIHEVFTHTIIINRL